MFIEQLEARQLLVSPEDMGTIWETFPGNYIPPQEYVSAAGTVSPLTAPAAGNKLDIAIAYLKQNAGVFGGVANDFNRYTVSSQYTDQHNGVTHIYLQQTFNGLPVADAVASVNLNALGQIISAGSNFVTGLPHPAVITAPQPAISAGEALSIVGSETGRSADISLPEYFQTVGGQSQKVIYVGLDTTALSYEPIPIELHYVPKPGGGVELAWDMRAHYLEGTHWFHASVVAQSGSARLSEIVRLEDWVVYASYNVLPVPVETPLDGARAVVTNPQDAVASPFGWHDTNGAVGAEFTDTQGNNVSAQEDRDGNNTGGVRPTGGAGLDFNFPLDLTLAPDQYTAAATTNLFYWSNVVHDVTYHYGFDEVSGNFQVTNYLGQGLGNDPVQADAQDGSGTNNANMATPPDGIAPRLQMFEFTLTTPRRDGDLDGFIITHEYGHGVSNRLTGGPANAAALQALQSRGMGEGWSDWLGLMLTQKPSDIDVTPQATGAYVLGQAANGPGVRRFPYSFDMTINPLTLGDYNGDTFPQQNNTEVHNSGEIWCSVLWDLNWNLINRYGYDPDLYNGTGGNNLTMQLVLDGMKLQPVNPTFIEARDAILAADVALTGGENVDELWTAFARRGFGLSASAGANSDSLVVVEAFDKPPPLARVSGRVINDDNGNGQINAGELGLAGWTIYVDANNNNVLDQGERNTLSGADGSYSISFATANSFILREIVMPNWKAIQPSSASYTINPSAGRNITGKNFLNQGLPGQIHGFKFNDLDGNGQRDAGEPGIPGIMIFVDVNHDGRIGILEPAAVTDSQGRFTIKNVRPGTYDVREVARPGLIQMFPDPLDAATLGGAHVGVVVVSNANTTNINFGNQFALDFGDAPASYGTLLANNGPRHGVLAGFGLTLNALDPLTVVDAEADGQPSSNAQGDDAIDPAATPPKVDDENGVQFLAGLAPGSQGEVQVGVRSTGFSPAYLHGWVDFNRDGDFLDPNEKLVFTNINGLNTNTAEPQLKTGTYNLKFNVPTGASLGPTFARFRYAFEKGLSPLGAALAGEVEDLTAVILQDQPIATDDLFPDRTRVPPDEFIQLNSDFTDLGNSLDVLRNDFGTSTDATPELVPANFPGPGQTLTTSAGGTIRFVGPTAPLQYRPKPGFTGVDTFQYQVTAGGFTSTFGTVTIIVSPSDPVAVDDIIRIPAASGAIDVLVLANDVAALSQQVSIVSDPTPLSAVIPQGLTLTRSATGDKLILTRQVGTPAATFKGTVRFAYTIDDVGDPTTDPSTAVVTIQITDGDTIPAASHLAIFKTRYLRADAAGDPILGPGVSTIFLADSDFFWVELVVQDPANAGDNPATTGVESAYIDMLISSFPTNPLLPVLVEPVLNAAGTNFVIEYEPAYGLVQRTDATFSVPGTVQEIGATRGSGVPPTPPPTGNGEVVVMRVKFRAFDGGSVIVQADHADSPQLPIALFNPAAVPIPGPLGITDDQVFIHKAGTLQIIPDGAEGEFTNRSNVYDVNGDTAVNSTDILLLINDLTQYGPRSLSQLAVALSGLMPPGYLDVNIDAQVNTIDILNLINYLTVRGATGQPTGEGEGAAEGESAPSAFAASPGEPDVGDPLGAMVNFLALQQSQDGSSASDDVDPSIVVTGNVTAEDGEPVAPIAPASEIETPTTTSSRGQHSEVDSEAADELFAGLSSFRERLRSRRLARR